MTTPRILKNFNLFVNGRGHAGKVEELELPEIAFKFEGYRGGGMDAETELDMGQEPMSAKFTFADPDAEVLRLVGITGGNSARVIARGAFVRDADGARVAVVAEMGGKFKKLGLGTWKAGEKGGHEYEMAINYFKLTVGGAEVMEIDVLNMRRVIGGVDQLAGMRADIGL